MFRRQFNLLAVVAAACMAAGFPSPAAATLDIAQSPLFAQIAYPPLNMLVMGRDHKLWYEAYNDASDLNGDGTLDVGYKGHLSAAQGGVTYFGYFDPNRCYEYDGAKFAPISITNSKTCSGAWSGDFLNYLTTSRIDALRKVLYGGSRSTDTTAATILERAFLPQDGHTWGKEYAGTTADGYDISQYAPLGQPAAGTRHLFANVSLADTGAPLLRVMANSTFRIWNWTSIERPVAGNDCFTNANARVPCIPAAGATAPFPGHPNSRAEMDTLVANYANATNRFGSGPVVNVNCDNTNCNPFDVDDNYLTIITGELVITADAAATGYNFSIDGDDAVDFRISDAAGTLIGEANFYGAHGFCNCSTNRTAELTLAPGTYRIEIRHEDQTGGDGYRLRWRKNNPTGALPGFSRQVVPPNDGSNPNGGLQNLTITTYNLTPPTGVVAPTRTDYTVRVQVCRNDALKEANCKFYPAGTLKPTGILHDFGENGQMNFGLITGSYANNTEGGVLRRAMGSFASEVDANNGTFTSVNGVARNLNRLRIVGFNYGNFAYSFDGSNCPALGTRSIFNGECTMWGNPIAEMMYESMRYFAGANAATPLYATGGSAIGQTQATTLGLSTATWDDPYTRYPVCSKPFQTVISDINPSYDTGLPGNPFGEATPNGATPSTISSFSAATQGDAIWSHEFGSSRNVFIGDSGGVADNAPSAKTASSFGNIRGLSPEEPSKEGGFYAASVGHYGLTTDVNAATGPQNLQTFSVALASPLPRIEFPLANTVGRKITLVPLGKSVGGCFGTNPTGTFQPTNTIVDFYVEELVNAPGQPVDPTLNGGRPYAVFRINYEDVEQGNDHDMDAIVRYELRANADDTVTVNLTSEYAAGCVIQHLGYVISGTTADGIYLEVRDRDTDAAASPAHWFNTPPGATAGQCRTDVTTAPCNQGLPLTATRTFSPGTTTGAELLRDPLFYAAKFGGFQDANANGLPEGTEWDETRPDPATGRPLPGADGVPDNYFLVTNALTLRDQLRAAFNEIDRRSRPSGGVAVSGVRIDAGSLSYIPEFSPEDWTGDLKARRVLQDGSLGPQIWSAAAAMPAAASRRVVAVTQSGFATTSPTVAAADFTVAGLGGESAAYAALNLTAAELNSVYNLSDSLDAITRVVAFLRGAPVDEQRNAGPFRNRATPIGDIVGSQPEVDANTDNFGYERLGGSLQTSYRAYLDGARRARPSMVYVAANDGTLRGFRTSDGEEVLGFIPSVAMPRLKGLLSPAYQHRYLNDGSPVTTDANFGGGWNTVLVGTAGTGGPSVYALNVTNPTTFGPSDVLWELTSAQDSDLGTRIGTVSVALAEGNRWLAVFGNGYNSASFDARVFVVDLATGNIVREFDVGDGDALNPNGVGNVIVVDSDGNGYSDSIYAGTYRGEIWKMNIKGANDAAWGLAVNASGVAQPLFVAERGGVRQPITGGIDVVRGPTVQDASGNNIVTSMVLFGTGRYFVVGDNIPQANPPIQSFYGVLDNTVTLNLTRSDLVEQRITSEVVDGATSRVRRDITQNGVDFETESGWFLDLFVQSGPSPTGNGERFIGSPAAIGGSIFFITFRPTGDECLPGGRNLFYGLDALTGSPVLLGATVGGSDPCGSSTGCGAIESGQGPPSQRPAFVVPPLGCIPGVDPGCANVTDCDPNDPTCTTPPCDPRDPSCVPPCDPATDPDCRVACPPGDPTCIPPPATRGQCLLVEFSASAGGAGGPNIRVIRPCGRQVWRQMQ